MNYHKSSPKKESAVNYIEVAELDDPAKKAITRTGVLLFSKPTLIKGDREQRHLNAVQYYIS